MNDIMISYSWKKPLHYSINEFSVTWEAEKLGVVEKQKDLCRFLLSQLFSQLFQPSFSAAECL